MNYRYTATNPTGKIFVCNNLSTLVQVCVRWTHQDESMNPDTSVGYVYHIAELEDTDDLYDYLYTYDGIALVLDDKTGQVTSVL